MFQKDLTLRLSKAIFRAVIRKCAARKLYVIAWFIVTALVTPWHDSAGQQMGVPVGFKYGIDRNLEAINLPKIDDVFLLLTANDSTRQTPETIGHNFKTHFTPERDGNWQTFRSGVDSWLLKLHSGGAYGMALVLSTIKLMPGEMLYLYNRQGIQGPYTIDNVPRSGILPSDFLKGDDIIIEYDVPASNNHHGTFVVETVSHAYRNIFAPNDSRSNAGLTTRINDDDKNCYTCLEDVTLDRMKRAVVKLVVHNDSVTWLCTGTLVNNTARNNTPYIITAQHCISNQADADRTAFIFGYDDDLCKDQVSRFDLVLNGAFLRASLFENDFSLVELYSKPTLEFQPYYAGWDISDQYLDQVTCIHHPNGGPKKVSLSNGAVRTADFDDGPSRAPKAYWNVIQWNLGVTEGGSSGASLLNKNYNIMGTLSGGSSECGAPYNDYFEKLSSSWTPSNNPASQLKHWLDPLQSNVQSLEGADPFGAFNPSCQTLSNLKATDVLDLLPYTNGTGYFSGCNSDGIDSYAEKFTTTDSAMLTGVRLNVGSINTESPGGLLVSIQQSQSGIPGPVLSTSYIPYSRLTTASTNYVGFYPYIKLIGDFFVTYTVSYSSLDSFALNQADWRSDTYNTAFLKLSSGWTPMSTISPNGGGSSLGIEVILCQNNPIEPPENEAVQFYPNPSTTVLLAKLPESNNYEVNVKVFDLQGRLQNVPYARYENNVVITTAGLSPGMYFVKISTAEAVYQAKFVKN